jgi:multisubunit Na+/H+ antiporter MnhF subunit
LNVQLPPLVFVIVLVAMAATVARAAVTRDRVAAFEFTVAAIIAVLVLCAFRLSRRTIRRA